MSDEERRKLLVKAGKIRESFKTLSPAKRKSCECAIEDYIRDLRKWESGSGLYPLPPAFLNQPYQPAAETVVSKENSKLDVKSLDMALSRLRPILVFAESDKHVALAQILRSAIAEAKAQRVREKPAGPNPYIQDVKMSAE